MTRTALLLAAGTLLSACAGGNSGDSGAPPSLPIEGKTPTGERWRLEAARPEPGDDVKGTWCLRLQHTAEIALADDPYAAGSKVCGPEPAPPVSGSWSLDCQTSTLYVFGVTRSAAGALELVPRKNAPRAATFAKLPAGTSLDEGRSFVVTADARELPGVLREGGQNPREIQTFAGERAACKGGQPFGPVP